jgi:hypothetical protein
MEQHQATTARARPPAGNWFAASRCPMSRAPLLFKESDVTRAVKAVRKAGVAVSRVEIAPDGRIVVHAGEPDAASDGDATATPLDAWLAVRKTS